MKVEIELNDRLYNDIISKAKTEGVKVNLYIAKLVEDKFYIDKYGDLNEIASNTKTATYIEIEKEETPKIEEEVKIPKKRGRKPKVDKVVEEVIDNKNESEALKPIEHLNEETKTEDEVLKKIVKRTRVLKSK